MNKMDKESKNAFSFLSKVLLDYIDSCIRDVLSDSEADPHYSAVAVSNLILCYGSVLMAFTDNKLPFHDVKSFFSYRYYSRSDYELYEKHYLKELPEYRSKVYAIDLNNEKKRFTDETKGHFLFLAEHLDWYCEQLLYDCLFGSQGDCFSYAEQKQIKTVKGTIESLIIIFCALKEPCPFSDFCSYLVCCDISRAEKKKIMNAVSK